MSTFPLTAFNSVMIEEDGYLYFRTYYQTDTALVPCVVKISIPLLADELVKNTELIIKTCNEVDEVKYLPGDNVTVYAVYEITEFHKVPK